MLLLDPGMGKTSITLGAYLYLLEKGVVNKMLIIAPLRVCHMVWPAEGQKWVDFQGLKIAVLHGKNKDEILQAGEADIYVINPEGLDWLIPTYFLRDGLRAWRKLGFDVLVIDELTKFKKSTGKRFKLLKKVIDTFSRRWGLTGTPAPNGLLDLFGQCYIIDGGNALGQYITHYRHKYFRPLDQNGWNWALQPGAADLIYEKLNPLALRMAAEDYLELPERVDVRHYIDLPPKIRKIYDPLEENLIAQYQNGIIVAGNAAAASSKCRQICNGSLYVDDDIASLVGGKKRTVMQLHELKLDALEEVLNELQGQQMLLAYEFNHDLEALRRRFGKDIPYIGKGVNTKRSLEIEREWNLGNIQFLPAQPASAGHGLNLQGSSAGHLGWYSMFWDYELYDQFIKRVLRQGNKSKRVINHHFVARQTTDEVIFHDKRRKAKNQNNLFEALVALRGHR